MPQSTEVQTDLRRAKLHAWVDRNVVALTLVAGLVGGCAIGATSIGIADRNERLQTAKRHDDEIRDLRMSCRKIVDERDSKVLEATNSATAATATAKEALEAVKSVVQDVADDAKASPASSPQKVKLPRKPPPDLNAAVREVNKRIEEESKK